MAQMEPIDLNKPTVFILGAGASQPYGLPLGAGLKDAMIRNVANSGFRSAIKNSELDAPLSEEFAEALRFTSHPTIDIFLEKKKKFRTLGAYLIAYTLLPLEKEASLFPARDWYAHLYDVIDFEHAEPDINNITFVSLNYDRSLEHFIMKNYQYNCSDDFDEIAKSKARNLNIIHAHGSLGIYPEVPYGRTVKNEDVLRNAVDNIRIVSDKLEDSDDFNHARNAILSAHNIIFIGFGYDPSTLEKLISDPYNMVDKRILGTVFHLQSPSIEFLQNYFNGKFEMVKTNISAVNFIKQILPLS